MMMLVWSNYSWCCYNNSNATLLSCMNLLFPSHKTYLNTEKLILNLHRHTNMPMQCEIYLHEIFQYEMYLY